MPPFTLEIIFRILGIGAASGLAVHNNALYIISDNAAYLYEYRLDERELRKIPLTVQDIMTDIPKADKFDFEAIAVNNECVYIFGSGSTDKRCKVAIICNGNSEIRDHSNLYEKMRKKANISNADFNIEGASFNEGKWYLLQRGNGPLGRNGIFVTDASLSEPLSYHEVPLPEIDGNRFGFTDMTIHKGKIYFIAASEKVLSTYHDGEIAGSLFGAIDLSTMRNEWVMPISKTHKFEGIAFYGEKAGKLTFLLCEDSDAASAAADIYLLSTEK